MARLGLATHEFADIKHELVDAKAKPWHDASMSGNIPNNLVALKAGGKAALAKALADLESKPNAPEILELLDDTYANPTAQVIGLTGPPGVGKSTLAGA